MKKQFAVAALCVWTWTLLAEQAAAQNMELTSRDIIRALQAPLDMAEFQNPGMTLKEVVSLIHDHVAAAGVLGKDVGLPLRVDNKGFRETVPEAADLYDTPVKFPAFPKKMSVAAALSLALSQAPAGDPTYVIRGGTVVITPTKQNRMANLLKQHVLANFDKKPLEEALHELAEQTGVSIQLDSRAVKEKQNIQVTALFRNDTSLRDALIVLADMASLKVVELPSTVYITSPTNAEALEKSRRDKSPKK